MKVLRSVFLLSAVAGAAGFAPAPRPSASTELQGILSPKKKAAPAPKKSGFTFGGKKAAPKKAAFSGRIPAVEAKRSSGIQRGFSKEWNPITYKPFEKDPNSEGYITRGFSKSWNSWTDTPFRNPNSLRGFSKTYNPWPGKPFTKSS